MLSKPPTPRSSSKRPIERRSRFFAVLGAIVVAGLSLVAIAGAIGWIGPGVLSSGTAFMVLGGAILILAGATVVMLFSIDRTIRVLGAHDERIEAEHAARIEALAQFSEDNDNRHDHQITTLGRELRVRDDRIDGIQARQEVETAEVRHALRDHAAYTQQRSLEVESGTIALATDAHDQVRVLRRDLRGINTDVGARIGGADRRIKAIGARAGARIDALQSEVRDRVDAVEDQVAQADHAFTVRMRELERRITSRVDEEDHRVGALERMVIEADGDRGPQPLEDQRITQLFRRHAEALDAREPEADRSRRERVAERAARARAQP